MTTRLLPAADFQDPAEVPGARSRFGFLHGPAARGAPAADEALAKLYSEQARPLLSLAALLVWVAVRPAVPLLREVTATAEYFSDSALPPRPCQEPPGSPLPAPAPYPRDLLVAMPEMISGIAEEIVHDAFTAMHRDWRRLRTLNRASDYLRRAIVDASRSQPGPPPGGGDGRLSARSARVLAALRRLPDRQREALVLHYYADLPEPQAAAAMGVTRAAFRGHAASGMSALRRLLDS